jgi:hypothetical protein
MGACRPLLALGDIMIIRRQSIITSKINSMNIAVTEEQIKKWQEGMMIQDAMPDLTANERELILSH